MNRNWTNDIQKLLGDAQHDAPKNLLGDIKKEMARRGVGPACGASKARVVSLRVRRWCAVAASVVLLVGLGVCLLPHDHQTNMRPVAVRGKRPSSVRPAQHLDDGSGSHPDDAPLATALVEIGGREGAANNTASHDRLGCRRLLACAPEAATSADPVTANVTPEQQPAAAISLEEAPKRTSSVAVGETMGVATAQGEAHDGVVETRLLAEAHDGRPVQVAAHVAGMPSANLNGVVGNRYMSAYDMAVFGPNSSGEGSSALSGVTHAMVPGVKARHHQPVQVGVSVRVPIGRRWSLQTGVNYAYLKSEFKDAVRPKEVVGTQALHYLGVPVNLSYDVWNTRRLNVYATAGGEVQQLVKGVYKSETGDEGVKEKRPVMSVNVAVGAAFMLSRSVSVYAEPGLSYHFKNGSGVESAYTERPLGFSLNVGLRWSTK